MNTNSPERNAQDLVSEHGVGSDADNMIDSKRTAVVLIMSLLATVLPAKASAKSESSVRGFNLDDSLVLRMREQLPFMDWDRLTEMSWPEMKEKLEDMKWAEILRTLDLLSRVATHAKEVGKSGVGEKIEKGISFSAEDKAFFLEMADKYNISDLQTLGSILDKEKLSSRDFDYLMVKFKEILRKQRHFAQMYARIRGWLNSKLSTSNLFDSAEDFNEWAEDNVNRMQKFIRLANMLKAYEESLSRETSSGPTSMTSPYVPYEHKRAGNAQPPKQAPKPLPKQQLRRGQNR